MVELADSSPGTAGFSLGFEDADLHDLRVKMAEEVGAAGVEYRRRLVAGHILGVIGDPRLCDLENRMAEIPEETVTLGWSRQKIGELLGDFADIGMVPEWLEKSCPEYQLTIPAFRMSLFPVTHGEYAEFLGEVRDAGIPTAWPDGTYPAELSNHPVSAVSYESAAAYCDWLSARTGRHYRLPTEPEWEYAAAGVEGRIFPWGNRYEPDRANTHEQGSRRTTPVGIFPLGVSPFGLHDMGGNVEEWTSTRYAPHPGGRLLRDNFYDADHAYRITRGGSFRGYRDLATCQRRHAAWNDAAVGFRIAETA